MKIDAETLKKQVILHLPYVLFLLVFAKLGEAVRLAPGADASQKLLPRQLKDHKGFQRRAQRWFCHRG